MTPTLFQLALGLLQNTALLGLGVLLYCWLRGPLLRLSAWIRQPVEGLFCAALAVLCMSDPLWLATGVQIDARNAIVAVPTLFGGPGAGIITAAAAAGYRLWIGGVAAPGGATIVFVDYAVTVAFWYFLRRGGRELAYRHLVLLAVAIAVTMLLGLLVQPSEVARVMLFQAGIPALSIVPASVFILGAIVLRFERARSLERSLALSEARLRAVIDNMPDPLTIKDRDNRLLLVNKAFENVTGRRAMDLMGRDIALLWDKLGNGEALAEHMRAAWRSGRSLRSSPMKIVDRGREFWLVATSFPIPDADGAFDAFGSVTTDVTPLLEAQTMLERREAVLRRHHQALVELVRTDAFTDPRTSFAAAVRIITEMAAAVLEVEYASVYQVDERAGVSRCVDDWMRSLARHGTRPDAKLADFRDLLAGLERERIIAFDDVLADTRLAARHQHMRERDMRSGILAGIYFGTAMRGHVTFITAGESRRWTAEDISFARSVADVIGLVFVTTQLREALASLDLVSDAIYVEHEDGRVIYANGPALSLAGLAEGTAISPPSGGVFPRPADALIGERDAQEVAWPQGGSVRDLEIRRARLPDGGVVAVITDVTAKKLELRERERLQLHLQQASKMEAIGQLAGGIAHDFNNLLAAVTGFARFLEQDLSQQSEQRQYAERILSACNRGKELVAQILSFTKARTLERKPVDLRTVLAEARQLLAASLPSTTRLTVAAAGPPVMVEGNEAQLQQVVVNLCLNAHDALGGEPGQVRVSLSRLKPGADVHGKPMHVGVLDPGRAYARLEVSDSGSGIPAEHMARIFEPFFTTKERGRGTGLGLAVVHGIVGSYDGACNVESRIGQGTRFSVFLPLAEQVAATLPDREGERDLRGSERVLIVDDEVDITDVLSIGLERLGYEVAAVNDAAEALAVFSEEPAVWDAVVTDQLMPGMKGLVLAEKLKSLRSDIVVILCTGLDDGIVDRAARAQGADAFFAKPVEPEQIAATIRNLVGG
jgi:PAS domain S-box-containing protein